MAHPTLPDVRAVSMTTDAAALIRGGKPRTLPYPHCMDPDLVDEYERAVSERDKAKSGVRDSLSAGAVAPELEQRVADLLEQVEAKTVTLLFQALPKPEFKALRDLYPPRRNDDGQIEAKHIQDARYGINFDDFWEPFIRASLVSPELDDETMTVLIEERFTDGQWDDVTTKVWNLNQSKVDVSFLPAASTTTPSSGLKSRRRNGSASA